MSMYRKKRKCDGVWVWYVQYFDPAGKRRTEQAGTTRDAAVRLYGQRLEEVRNGKWEAPEVRRRQAQMEAIKRERLTFRNLAEEYKRECLNRYTRKREVVACFDRLVHYFGDRHIEEITRWQVQQYKRDRTDGVAKFNGWSPVGPRSVNLELSYGRRMLTWAIYEADLPISRNVFSRFRRLNEQAVRRKAKVPTPEEFGNLVDAADERLRPFLLTLWFTGMRHGEAVNLRKSTVNIPWQRITLERTKNGDSRQILIHSHLLPVLEKAIADSSSDFVFTGRGGRPLNTRRLFAKARTRAGLPHLWLHDLRKAFVTHARGAGHDDKTVASLAGHRDLRMSDLYMTPTEAQLRAAVESIPAPTTADHLQTANTAPLTPTQARGRSAHKSFVVREIERTTLVSRGGLEPPTR